MVWQHALTFLQRQVFLQIHIQQLACTNNQVSGLGYCMAAYAYIPAAAGVSADPHIATVTCMCEQKGQLA
jgi:hypothetical protein